MLKLLEVNNVAAATNLLEVFLLFLENFKNLKLIRRIKRKLQINSFICWWL